MPERSPHIVLAGYGSIAHAFESILRFHNPSAVRLTVCELKQGCDCLDYIADHAEEIDVVLNLCTQPAIDVLSLCIQKKIDYADAGLEGYPNEIPMFDYFEQMRALRGNSRILLGFGVNPGILEHVYFKFKPKERHLAFEFEYDEATSRQEGVFNTWSPSSYYDEAVPAGKFLAVRRPPGWFDITEKHRKQGPFRLTAGGREREFMMIPHEELFSFTRLEKNCLGAGYLYQAPLAMQNFCRLHGDTATEEDIAKIPVRHDLDGLDHTGMLFYDFTDNLRFAANTASHREKFEKFGVNATCWQTACGMHVALALLPFVEKGVPVTMSDLSLRYGDVIDAVLDDLGFRLEVTDFAVNRMEFEKTVLPFFPPQ